MNTPLTDLPDEWQQHIKQLRIERAALRKRLPAAKTAAVIQQLRREIAQMRVQRNEARTELAALRAERP